MSDQQCTCPRDLAQLGRADRRRMSRRYRREVPEVEVHREDCPLVAKQHHGYRVPGGMGKGQLR